MRLRVAFMGTPDFAVPTLRTVAARHDVVAVYTRAPAAFGRGLRARPSPVQAAADELGLLVESPATLRDEDVVATFRGYRPDVAVVVAYGMLLPQRMLDVPRFGCLNLHASRLPRWRGAAPIQRAILAGDRETGICAMRMEAGLDTGPVALSESVPIGPDVTSGDLGDELAVRGADLIARALDALTDGRLTYRPQPDSGATYARKITNEEARVDWSRSAGQVHDHVRGLSPFPGAFTLVDLGRGPERVKVLRTERSDGAGPPGLLLQGGRIACGDGAVRLVSVQRAGKGPVPAAEFLRGARLEPGAAFG